MTYFITCSLRASAFDSDVGDLGQSPSLPETEKGSGEGSLISQERTLTTELWYILMWGFLSLYC